MTSLSEVTHIYADLGAGLPEITQIAMRATGLLAYYGIVLTLAVGPLLACVHLALRMDPPKKRRFQRAVAATLLLGSAAFLLPLCLTLLIR